MASASPSRESSSGAEEKRSLHPTIASRLFPAQHRRPAVLVLVLVFIVLQLVSVAVVTVQSFRLMDMEQRIEQLEKTQLVKPPPGENE